VELSLKLLLFLCYKSYVFLKISLTEIEQSTQPASLTCKNRPRYDL